jgi:hypothetical protein
LEGETQTMTLQNVDPSLFGAVVHWCYQEKIDEMQQDENGNIIAIKEGRLVVLAKMWMLGQVSALIIPSRCLLHDGMLITMTYFIRVS